MTTAATTQRTNGLLTIPRVKVSDGSIEAIKWLAVLLMTLDHVNKYIFGAEYALLFELGRIAMPLFVMTMAYNLARPGALDRGTFKRSCIRLFGFGLIACIPYILLAGGRIFPLNILFLLLIVALSVFLFEKGGEKNNWLAMLLILFGSFFVEYWHPGVALGIAAWWFFKKPSAIKGALVIALTASIWIINHNYWALAALPIFFACAKIDIKTPRTKWYVFYSYYPLHLAIILAATKLIA